MRAMGTRAGRLLVALRFLVVWFLATVVLEARTARTAGASAGLGWAGATGFASFE